MFRRRCGAVIDEEYVQEHILTDGIVAPLEAPRRLIHGRSAISVGVVASHPTHLFRSGRFVLLLRVAAAPSNATRSTRDIADQANAAEDRRRAEVCLAGAS
jgi:hypothetical protein